MFLRHNQSSVPEFFLLGFQVLHGLKTILLSIFLVVYILTITGNLLIIMLVSVTHHLQSPMYFFLSHLSFCDIMISSTIVPNLLWITLWNGSRFTVTKCIIQLHLFFFSSATECLLLTVMSYDRYVAICKPLHYQTVMNSTFCLGLTVLSWMLPFGLTLIITFLISRLDFCKSHNIDHFFCDYAPLLQASCSDTTVVQVVGFILATPETIIESVFIISTYVCIFLAIHRISSTTGKQKAFSTCSSHLAVVCTYYGSLIAIYVAPSGGNSSNMNKMLSLIYTVLTPLSNPIIYSLRNHEIKAAMKNILKKGTGICYKYNT